MKKLLLPIGLLIVGVGGGVGAGLALVPANDQTADLGPCGELPTQDPATDHKHTDASTAKKGDASAYEYAKLSNQFVVPVVRDGSVSALVVLALNLEVEPGSKETVFLAEPKLRDDFLQAMFDHANIGGFDGNFTSSTNMRPLREELTRRAQAALPGVIHDVLIVDIVRQDS